MSVTLSGMDALISQLNNMAANEEPVKRIIRQRTSEINRKAQRLAPVDTGELRRSIISDYTNGGLTGRVSAGMHYAPYVEYGTRFNTAQPFLRPAFEEISGLFIEDIRNLVR